MRKLKNAPVLMVVLFVLVWAAAVFVSTLARAQTKEIITEGEYNMGDGETPSAAESRAILNAKRDALEQAGTYVRSYTKVKNATLTEDEIEVIASGIMEVTVIDKKRTIIGGGFKFWVKIKAAVQMEKIDEMAKRVKDRQVVEDYKRIKEAYDNSRQEIEELKKKLAEAQNETEKKAVVANINKDELGLKATEWYEAGYRHFRSKAYDIAIEDFSKAILLKPDYDWAYIGRGVAYSRKGQHDKVIEDFSKAISLKPDHALVYISRGMAYSSKGQHDMAIEDFNKAISLKSNLDDAAYNNRGLAYYNKGQHDMAIEDFNKAISLKPNYADAYNNRGLAYNDGKGQYDMAIKDFNKAISLRPDDAAAYNNRGLAYYNKGQHDMAIKDFNKAISLKPDYAEAYYNRGLAYGEKSQYDMVIKDVSKAISLKPNFATAYSYRGTIYIVGFKNLLKGCADLKQACALGDCKEYEEFRIVGACK